MCVITVIGVAAAATFSRACDAKTFSRDLGNVHCTSARRVKAATAQECAQACCSAGEACQTYQWCEEGRPCADGFDAQPGALSRGNDISGWPRNTTLGVAEAACRTDPACIGLTYHSDELHPSASTVLHIYLKNESSGAMQASTWSRRLKTSAGCYLGRVDATCNASTDGWSSRAMPPRPAGPCDILASAGTPCVAAHSVTRALYANYTGPLYRVLRDSDKAALDIGVDLNLGTARVAEQDEFCKGTDDACFILRVYDQSERANHLDTAPAGGYCKHPLSPVSADKDKISIGGTQVYGMYFEGNMGYRNDRTSGVATGETAQTMYMVTRGDHVNSGCCFDYGNAETDNNDDGKGTMEALYFGTSSMWSHGNGTGPWVMADLENGLWAGNLKIAPAPSVTHTWVTAMAKGKKGVFALKGGDAQKGGLPTLYEGPRPSGYETMRKQGAIILGIGGDNSCSAIGTFYEGAMTATYTTDATDAAVQANIVAAGYGQ